MKKTIFYILDNRRRIVPVDDTVEFCNYFAKNSRRVDYTEIVAGCFVSTVFLGVDHNFSGDGPPILFETMVFGGEPTEIHYRGVNSGFEDYTRRYATYGEAHKGHWEVVDEVKKLLKSSSIDEEL